MENKLRQLENQQLPDLSHMDDHWKNMQAMLQPPASTGGKIIQLNKWFWVMGLVVLTGVVILFTVHRNEVKESGITVAQTVQPKVTIVESSLPLSTQQVNRSLIPDSQSKKLLVPEMKRLQPKIIDKSIVGFPVQLNTKDSTIVTIAPDRQKMLNELLIQLAKKTEEFIIDNSRDTVLFAEEGSSLFIPANSLGGNNAVKISLREFYKTSDIISQRLSTTCNQEQLVTGGMVHISAVVNNKPINILPGKAIKLYMPDTSRQMEQMQLFTGEEKQTGAVNWINTRQNFGRPTTITEVRVLDIRNEPFKTVQRKNGLVAVFAIDDHPEMPRKQLKTLLKDKYGYHKVRFRNSWRSNFRKYESDRFPNLSYSENPIGDSAWMDKKIAEKYRLGWTASRTFTVTATQRNEIEGMLKRVYERKQKGDITSTGFDNELTTLQNKYSVDISSLGWINCDRFYADSKEKIDYAVNLADSAANFYTILVFDRIRSMMAGYPSGNKILFTNVPPGEPVKIVSIGIGKDGHPILAIKETFITKNEFTGLQFEVSSANTIKSSLSKMDRQP